MLHVFLLPSLPGSIPPFPRSAWCQRDGKDRKKRQPCPVGSQELGLTGGLILSHSDRCPAVVTLLFCHPSFSTTILTTLPGKLGALVSLSPASPLFGRPLTLRVEWNLYMPSQSQGQSCSHSVGMYLHGPLWICRSQTRTGILQEQG